MPIISDDYYVRETAILLLARDQVVGHDYPAAEIAVERARQFMNAYKNSRHHGDACGCGSCEDSCCRCVCDEALREAQEIHDN